MHTDGTVSISVNGEHKRVAAGLTMSTTTLTVLVGLSAWLMLVFQPDGSIGLYTFPHVVLATFAGVVAALSLRTVDPLRLRSVTHPEHENTFVPAPRVRAETARPDQPRPDQPRPDQPSQELTE